MDTEYVMGGNRLRINDVNMVTEYVMGGNKLKKENTSWVGIRKKI